MINFIFLLVSLEGKENSEKLLTQDQQTFIINNLIPINLMIEKEGESTALIDDKKIKSTNVELEERFKVERNQWVEDIKKLVKSSSDTSKLNEAQVYQLSYRQMCVEKISEYSILLEKRQELFDKQCASRFREYTTNYDLKLSGSEKQLFIQSDCSELKLQIKMISVQIKFFEESIKTLDNLGFAIRNKIEIVSKQLI